VAREPDETDRSVGSGDLERRAPRSQNQEVSRPILVVRAGGRDPVARTRHRDRGEALVRGRGLAQDDFEIRSVGLAHVDAGILGCLQPKRAAGRRRNGRSLLGAEGVPVVEAHVDVGAALRLVGVDTDIVIAVVTMAGQGRGRGQTQDGGARENALDKLGHDFLPSRISSAKEEVTAVSYPSTRTGPPVRTMVTAAPSASDRGFSHQSPLRLPTSE
jgi:hypothetical protein